MTVKEYLSQALLLNADIRAKQEQARIFADRARRMTRYMTDVPTGAVDRDKLQRCVDQATDLERDRLDELADLQSLQQEILHDIRKVSSRRYRLLLELRYVQLLDWPEVAERMGYDDVRSIYRVHSRALIAYRTAISTTSDVHRRD